MNRKLKVLVIEDNADLRGYLMHILKLAPNIDAAEAKTIKEGAVLARQEPQLVVLVDLSLPDAEGTEAVQVISQAIPGATIVVYTGTSDKDIIDECMRNGAHAVIEKGTPEAIGENLIDAIRRAVIKNEVNLMWAPATRRAHKIDEGFAEVMEMCKTHLEPAK